VIVPEPKRLIQPRLRRRVANNLRTLRDRLDRAATRLDPQLTLNQLVGSPSLIEQYTLKSDDRRNFQVESPTDVERRTLDPTSWSPKQMYLELLKSSLINHLYRGVERFPNDNLAPESPALIGWDGYRRMTMMEPLIDYVLTNDVPGDLAEAGVWMGGMTIFFSGFLRANGVGDRAVWNLDSFEGIPVRKDMELEKYPEDRDWAEEWEGGLSCSLQDVKNNFERFDLLGDNIKFIKGLFKDILSNCPIETISVLRVDADLYLSTTQVLDSLYAKVSPGGYVVFDDWKFEPVQRAIQHFREKHAITAAMQFGDTFDPIPYWQKV
jgi:O-methyltransferase